MNQLWGISAEPAADVCHPVTSSPLWEATKRYGCQPAPNGLVIVQEFLNTKANARCGLDLLGDQTQARSWAAKAVSAWSATQKTNIGLPKLNAHDAAKLRKLRVTIDNLLGQLPTGLERHVVARVELALDDDGRVVPTAAGHGWHWLASAIWSEILISQQTDTWQRLKQCRNPACRSTFYDRSWDKREVWHSATPCVPLADPARVDSAALRRASGSPRS